MRNALALVCLLVASTAAAAEMTLEKAQKFQTLWDKEQAKMLREADAELMEYRRQNIVNRSQGGDNLKRAKTYYNQIKRKQEPLTYPQLKDKSVGSIGVISCFDRRGWTIAEEGDYLTLDTTMHGIGSRDNGETTSAVPIPGYGKFMIRGFDPKFVNGERYLGAALVYEVVAIKDGLPVVEPFDVKAAKKLLAEQKRKRN